MKRLIKTVLFTWLLGFSVHGLAITDAHSAVEDATSDLLARLIEVKPLYDTDPDGFYAAVDDTLAPFIDFDYFSRYVMAKHRLRATTEQKAKFAVTFRKGLIETYAKALVEFDNQRVVVLKPTAVEKKPDRAKITLEIHGKSGAVYVVDYILVVIDDGWKLRNLYINGVNVGFQFRSQFRESMRKHKNDIDSVITFWGVDV